MSFKKLFIVLVSAMTVMSCAQRLGDIDQTRNYAVDKSLFQGEWYHRQMVTDIPYLGAMAAPANIRSATPMTRIRWEIQEGYLLAISQDENVPGKNDLDPGQDPDEEIVAKYAIISHFDTRRQYDAQTGEENREAEQRRLTINVSQKGGVPIIAFGARVVENNKLYNQLKREMERAKGGLEVRIRADRAVPYGAIEPLLVNCAELKIWNVQFAVISRGESGNESL